MDIRKIIREELEKVFEADYYDRYPDFMDPQFNPLVHKYSPVGMHSYGQMFHEEEILREDMKQISDIPDGVTMAIGKRDGGRDTFIVLFDYEEGTFKGMIGFQDEGGDNWVSVVAGEKGYGPLMYELAMMYSSPKGLMPSRTGDIEDKSKNIWIKFFNRDDIEKKPIDSSQFNEPFHNFFYDEEGEFDVDKMKNIFNTRYYKSPTPEFHALVRKSSGIIKNKKLDMEDVLKKGMDYFEGNYDE